ncbi:17.5 kDa class I heat shock protein [Seminavis robusta]|uniref:17.5 kDa class I heat shock protein n=1 Tax=Seminavis robusta TaxID=568900 RepID=A0A9N8HR54_9STRA|nr:17.5 kDa class I heat shock protein [Seminavis robusta]|eukprot:Sro1046_g235040.1 17.5 kDa class I heat shock protein (159) ;mRNA; f:14982-15458
MALSRFNRNAFDPFYGFREMLAPSPFMTRDPFFDDCWMPVIRSQFDRDFNDMVLRHSSPGYEINENDKKYEISMDLPGVKASEMTAQLEQDGRVLHVHGGRKVEKDGKTMETRFEKRFTIGSNVDTSRLSAKLSNGVLTVSAPKTKPAEPTKIAITEG